MLMLNLINFRQDIPNEFNMKKNNGLDYQSLQTYDGNIFNTSNLMSIIAQPNFLNMFKTHLPTSGQNYLIQSHAIIKMLNISDKYGHIDLQKHKTF